MPHLQDHTGAWCNVWPMATCHAMSKQQWDVKHKGITCRKGTGIAISNKVPPCVMLLDSHHNDRPMLRHHLPGILYTHNPVNKGPPAHDGTAVHRPTAAIVGLKTVCYWGIIYMSQVKVCPECSMEEVIRLTDAVSLHIAHVPTEEDRPTVFAHWVYANVMSSSLWTLPEVSRYWWQSSSHCLKAQYNNHKCFQLGFQFQLTL